MAQDSYDYDDFEVTLSSDEGDLTWNNEAAPGSDGDGIGIDDDEISSGETLKVAFSKPMDISKIGFLDFFEYGSTSADDDTYSPEQAHWETDGGSFTRLADNGQSSSEASLEGAGEWNFSHSPDLSGVNWIEFSIGSTTTDGDDNTHDFALADIEASPSAVPIPGAVWLLGSGLLGLVGLRRKRK